MNKIFAWLLMVISHDLTAQINQDADSAIFIFYTTSGPHEKGELTLNHYSLNYSKEIYYSVNDIATASFSMNITKNTWKTISRLLSIINLETLPKIPAPSSGRLKGTALYAKLAVKTANKTYATQEFDAGKPVAEITALLKYINSLVNPAIVLCE